MKREGLAKHFLLAFLLALVGYIFFYQTIEHRRTRKGPWQVTFSHNTAGDPAIIIAQPKLAITNVQISFLGEIFSVTNAAGPLASRRERLNSPVAHSSSLTATLLFAQPKPVPYEVPFGQCLFMDTTFLPGTITLQIFGHEIELLPRVLVIDGQEHPWRSDITIALPHRQAAPAQAKP
jgi:hypothetical protein